MLNLNEMAFIFGGKVMNFRDMKRKERWSIRKLTVGAASVLLGTYFVASSQGVAKADTVKDNNVNNNTVNEQTSEKKISQPITPNTQAVVIAKNNHQNSENNTANLQNKADLIRQNNQKIINRLTVQKNTIQKVENSTFSEIKTREAANTQPFNIAENSSKSVATNSNNSLDESTFGKVDVNSWDTETVNNGLNITGYHGSDQEHLVIPNAADFTKAGKLTDEDAVITVNAAKFKKILNTVKPITVAISTTDNRKVQVSDKTAFGGNLTTENGVSTNDPNLKQMDLTNLDTSNLTDMSGMFCGAYKVKSLGNLSGWDVSHVTNMQQMFDENTYDSPALEALDGINKWNVSNVQNILCLFRNDINLKDIDISGWDLSKATGGWTTGQVFASFTNASKTVINLNNVKLPSDFNFATSFANGQVVITNNGDLLQLDTTSKVSFKDNLTFRQYNSWVEYANPTVKTYSHSIFYDSKGSSDAKAIVQDAIDTFLHNNYANYKKITIPTDAVYLSTKPSDSATAIANGTYDIAKTETSDTTYQVFRDDEIPMQLKYVETDTNKDLGTVTVVGNGITIVTSHSIGLNPLPITNLADWLGNDDYTKSDMSITGQKHFGFDGIAEPVNVEIHLTKKVITEQRTVTIHLYERDSNGNPVKDSNGNYVSVAPDLKATFNYQQDEFVTSKGKVVKKSNIWLWDEKAPKTYDGANSQEVNVGYVEGVGGVTPIISNVKCWKVPINKEGTSYILVPNDGNWSTVEFSTPAVDGYYANPFIDNIVNGYPLLGRPANLFVNPRFNNSVRPGTSDTSDSSIAYTNQDGIYENKNEHIIWYFPKENTATIKRTINFVKNDASHTQLQETSTQDVNLNGSLVAANPNGTGKDYFTIYPAEYNDASIVTGSPIAVINNSNKPTYSWKAKDGQTSVNTDITGYTVSAVKIGNADYSMNENDIKYAKEIAQNTATLDSPADLNISFVYAPVSLSSSYQFVDDDNKEQLIAPATSFSGQTGETVELNIKLPDNYELAKGSTLPTSYTFKPSDNEQLKIHLIHQKKVLSDDTRTIRRKVTITDPDGKVDPKSTTQSVSFSRSDTLDKVTNQHIYGKWNTKQQALPAIILPVFAGYTPSGKVDAINVTADSNNPADINISYIADKQNSSYKFVDDNENEATVGTSHPISGTTDETIDLTKAIKDSVPTNYDLVPDQNMSYIFKASDNKPLIIHLTHHISAVTNDPKLMKKVTRTINVTKPDGTKLAPVIQSVSFIQTATKDDVTGKVTYNNDWKVNGADSFTEYDAPVLDGYTANPAKIEKFTPNVNTKDSTKNIVYEAGSQSITVRFIDKDNKDQQVGEAISINGVTGESADFSAVVVPENYVLAEGSNLPTNHKFTADDQTVYTIDLRHKTEDAKIDPNAKLSQKVSRTILITKLDGSVNKIIQEHTFTRTGTKDMVTGNISYGPWSENGKYNFSDITAKAIAGYAIIGSAPEIVVTPETKDSIVNISYLANGQTNYYQFIDDDYQAGDPVINQRHNFAGKTGDRINLNITVPQNYDLVKGTILPTTYTFKANNNQPIVIHLVHHLSAITNDPKLMKKVTRTINVTKPDGTKLAPVVQSVSFIQTAAKDDVTEKVTYHNDWKANGIDSFAEYSVPVFAGYTASQTKVEKVIPNINTQNSTINITYQANPQKISVRFIDDDNQKQQVGSAFIINGVTDGNADFSTVAIPENYVLAEGSKLPTNHKFTANDQTVYTVELRHKTEDAKIDPNAKLSQKVSRTISITNIDGKVDKTVQEHTFTRTGQKDMVTGNISYGPWSENGKYIFASVPIKEIAGYAINGSAPEVVVTPETKDSTINISYLANGQTSYYQFIDDDYQTGDPAINQKHSIAGKTGENVKLNISIPENYSLAKGSTLPTSYTFKVSENKPLVIHLIHQKDTLPNDIRTISRKVVITDPNGKVDPKSTTQLVTFNRSDVLDKVTNRHTYGEWNKKQETLPAIDLPVFAGYTPSGKVNEIDVTAASHNPSDDDIVYNPDRQNSFYQFVDDNENGATVGINYSISGVTAETIDLIKEIKAAIPTNYDLVPDQKMSYTFKASDNDPLIIHLTHHISKVVNDPSLTKTVRRTILITNINGKVDKTVQEHTFTRTGKKDMVTEIIKYGPWSENGKYTFAAIPVKAIEGYAINGSVPEVVVTPETMDSIINIGYVANGQTSYYQFIDDDSQAGDPVINQKHPIAGKTGETIKLNISIPENYSLIEGSVLPTSYTFESGNKPIIIHLIHQKESLPNDTKTISRKVTIIDPDGKVDSKSTTQSVTFSRNDILDKVTNKHIYGKWNEAQQTLPSIDLPSFNGYTPTGEVTAAEVTTNSGDIADINISYVPNEQTSYYEFVDDDNHESLIAPATVISGRTGETIKLNIVTPNGYALAKDVTLPRSYRFKATNNEPIIIHLVHHMSKVTNDPKLTKVITRTINVINPHGTTDSIVQTVRFVQTATKDDVTNSVSYMNDWKNVGAESFAEYNVPEIAGYTSSKTKVEKLTPKFGDQNVIVNIDYIKKSQINPVKPVKPIVTPIEKDNKEQSANKQQTVTAEPNSKPKVTQEIKQPVSKPNKTNGKILERKDRQTYKFQGQTVTMKKVVNAKEAGHINKIKAKKAALPQTGNDEAKTTAIIASGLAVNLSLIGLAGLKKKRSN
ncbi:Gram-positive signal peptide protein, YSIRK family [Lactobacillus paragasseri JV-V03]|uniref:Gram-positive signal peptide protein, YSIRK family n=2 Tax=Lactobacillus paragasseri TaxID=2107999 RepID=A0AA87AMV7_9LACO|nr:Gram-positive signal peptide protein, YSIRK family [Lactobacillus paragasseri JV-V03]